MDIGNLLLSFLDPGIGEGFLRALAVILNLALITSGVTLFAYMFLLIRKKDFELEQTHKKVPAGCYVASVAVTIVLIALSVFATLDQSQGALTSGGYSLADLARFITAILDPLLDIRHLADRPVKELFGLNLIVRIAIIYTLIAALQIAVRQSRKISVHFDIFLKEKLLAALPDEIVPSKTANDEKTATDELQLLVGRIIKFLISSGAAIFAAFVLGSDDMRESISEVLTILGEILNMITLMSNVTPASGFFSNAVYTLLSIVMLAVYTTAALLLIIFIHTILKSWSLIKSWIIQKATTMRTGLAAVLLAIISLAVVIGIGVCLQKYPSLQLQFANGLAEILHILANYAVLILAIVVTLMLLVFAVSFLVLLVSFARQIYTQKKTEWAKDFKDRKYWRIAKAAACVILAGILLVAAALCYDKLRGWLMTIFNPGDGIFSPFQVFKHAAIFAAFLEGLFLLISTAAVLGFIIFWGIVEFFLTTRKAVVNTASKLVKETLTSLLNTLLLIPFFFSQALAIIKQALLVIKSVIITILQIFIGYRTESDKNNAVFMAACFASLASLLNTFFGLYQFYGGGEQISGYSGWIRTICTFAIACAAQLAMLIFGMKAGEGLAEQRIVTGSYAKDKLIRFSARIILAVGIIAASGCLYMVFNDIFPNGVATVSPKDLVKYIPWLLGLVALFAVYFWLRKKYRQTRTANDQSYETLNLAENISLQPVLAQSKKRGRLPFYWYLAVYLLLMIVSTGFAYSNLFGYYAHGAKVHERIYAQVRYETDHQLQLGERVAQVTDEYAQNTRNLGALFSARAADIIQARDNKLAELQNQADHETGELYFKRNRRDKFIGATNDLEQIVSNIQTFLTSQYDDIGSDTAIAIEEYAHYWATNGQPSYKTTCIMISYDGLQGIEHYMQLKKFQNDGDDVQDEVSQSNGGSDQADAAQSDGITAQSSGNVIIIGTFVPDIPLHNFGNESVHDNARGQSLPNGRIVDPTSKSNSIIKTSRYVFNADKYDILKELFNQYERMENFIYNYDVPDESSNDGSENEAPDTAEPTQSPISLETNRDINTIPQNTISDVFYSTLDRNAQLDGIRANIAALYRNSTNSYDSLSVPQTSLNPVVETVSMLELPGIADAYLSGGDSSNSDAGSGLSQTDSESDGKTALPEYEKLSDYIDRALSLNSILQSFDTGGDGAINGTSNGRDWSDAVYKTQQYRNYARSIAHLEFQISYDALFRGRLNMNPVRNDIDELYTTAPISIFLLVICLLIDMLAFFSGLLLFKNIYLFGKNSGILQMGYLNYEIALSYLFTPPTDFHCRVLHLAFMYRVLYGDASTSMEPEDGNIEEFQPSGGESGIDMSELEENISELPPESDNVANVAPEQESGSTASLDTESSVTFNQSDPDEQNSNEDDIAAPNESVSESNSQTMPDEDKESEAPVQDSDSTVPDADSTEDASLPQQERSNSIEQAETDSQPNQIEKYFQDMDYLHRIMCSADYRNLDANMRATLQILGITAFDDSNAMQADGLAFLQLWLRNFIEEKGITFDELFPPKEDD